MPVFKAGEGQAPEWSELAMFEIIGLAPGQNKTVAYRGPRERWIHIRGEVTASFGGQSELLKEYGYIDIPCGAEVSLSSDGGGAVVRMAGSWGDEMGGTGIFRVSRSDEPWNPGDAAGYERNANFDNHYHDCDEYWIVYEGRGRAVSEGTVYEVGLGDCIATGRGYHHDFPFVYDTVSAVFFETTLVGKKRPGHLWSHRHGAPEPEAGRV